MDTSAKHLDRKFLSNYYMDMVNDAQESFEIFLADMPNEIQLISELLTENKINEAGERIHKITPSFLSIGLPQLSIKLQTVEVFINYSNLSTAKSLMRLFITELNDYLPAIQTELERLVAQSCSKTSV